MQKQRLNRTGIIRLLLLTSFIILHLASIIHIAGHRHEFDGILPSAIPDYSSVSSKVQHDNDCVFQQYLSATSQKPILSYTDSQIVLINYLFDGEVVSKVNSLAVKFVSNKASPPVS